MTRELALQLLAFWLVAGGATALSLRMFDVRGQLLFVYVTWMPLAVFIGVLLSVLLPAWSGAVSVAIVASLAARSVWRTWARVRDEMLNEDEKDERP